MAEMDLHQIATQTKQVLEEFFEQVTLPKNSLFVLGCSSSEVAGLKLRPFKPENCDIISKQFAQF